jgi:hypothetical protein
MLYEFYLNKYFYFNFILKKNEINKSFVIKSIIRMDNEYNYDNDNESNDNDIRAPDIVKKEQLLQDNRSEYDKQMDEAMCLSIQEFKNQEESNQKYEDELIIEHSRIINERKDLFRAFLFDLNKLIRLDKDMKEIYEIIEPIIDYYCAQYITQCEIDPITYDRIFKVIGNIRTNKNNIELLKKIIIKSE